ncbi:hypothetical protein XA68_18396 [Ophiocordyceps unilateralis]|uniref:54S ribosomal protein L31, mitochondrial n=1 Tax=Ophiocordyceps unilateralis TaxID=268505 RepID=A0A2A9PJ14_OPHUN|nr:hypothetical protein XA68_18396 [Ophiocordyceps unilateralis]
MLGPFRITNVLSGGLLWKIPWRLSKFQKRRHRERLRAVDDVVATVSSAMAATGQTVEAVERWKAEMPTEQEMQPRDKYTIFDRKAKRYRKGIHKLPKWTRRQMALSALNDLKQRLTRLCTLRREAEPASITAAAGDSDA